MLIIFNVVICSLVYKYARNINEQHGGTGLSSLHLLSLSMVVNIATIIADKLFFIRRDVSAIVMLTNVITLQVQRHTVDVIHILNKRTDTMRFIWIKKQYI